MYHQEKSDLEIQSEIDRIEAQIRGLRSRLYSLKQEKKDRSSKAYDEMMNGYWEWKRHNKPWEQPLVRL